MPIQPYLNHLPSIANSAYIAPSAEIIGQVTIGKDSSIWPYAVVRGDMHTIRIGNGTSIQDGSVLHITHDGPYCPGGAALNVGNFVTVGHKVVLHACTVHDLCLIGIGSIVLDKAVIESNTIIGAGSLVPSNKILPSGYLWHGSPVKQIRNLTASEIESLQYSANRYIQLKNDYSHLNN